LPLATGFEPVVVEALPILPRAGFSRAFAQAVEKPGLSRLTALCRGTHRLKPVADDTAAG
jgi:hypothetical protein